MQIFILEMLVPFMVYGLIGLIPVRIVTAVPEIVAASLLCSQASVCVLAQMRFLLPLVLFSRGQVQQAQSAVS